MEEVNNNKERNKKTIGILFSLFFGILGLIVGLLMYKEGTEERATFIKGWVKGLIITIIFAFVSLVVYYIALNCF